MFKIEKANIKDIEEISGLAKRVYIKYNSKIDTEEGINGILSFISEESIKLRFYLRGAFTLVARDSNKNIVGIVEVRNFDHISLFFVDDKYFKCGIGKALFEEVKNTSSSDKFTVNASDYALEFYKKLGFVQTTDSIQIENGVHFYPMIY